LWANSAATRTITCKIGSFQVFISPSAHTFPCLYPLFVTKVTRLGLSRLRSNAHNPQHDEVVRSIQLIRDSDQAHSSSTI